MSGSFGGSLERRSPSVQSGGFTGRAGFDGNQRSVAIARTPETSITAISQPRSIGPLRSSQRASRPAPDPGPARPALPSPPPSPRPPRPCREPSGRAGRPGTSGRTGYWRRASARKTGSGMASCGSGGWAHGGSQRLDVDGGDRLRRRRTPTGCRRSRTRTTSPGRTRGRSRAGRFGAVAAVDQVVLLADREVAADGPGRGGDAVRGAEHRPRTTAIASFPSSTPTTTGPPVMNSIRPSKNGLPWCSA